MARSRFSNTDQDTTAERVDVRVREASGRGERSAFGGPKGCGGSDEKTTKHLIWWSGLYILFALSAVTMLSAWAVRKNGGFSSVWKDPEHLVGTLNYHPLFMVITFMLLSGIADVLHRVGRESNRLGVKIAHGTIQLTAFSFMVAGLCAVFWYHDQIGVSHLQSAHSWIGLIIVLLVSCQWIVGFCGLLWPGFRAPIRNSYLATHRFTGRCIFLLSMANILVGINKVSGGTTVMNVTALVVICYALNGAYILANNAFAREALGGEQEKTTVYERHTSIHSTGGGHHEENNFINISNTGTSGQYQSMGEDPMVKEAMLTGRDTFNRFHERLEKKKVLDFSAGVIPPTTTVITD